MKASDLLPRSGYASPLLSYPAIYTLSTVIFIVLLALFGPNGSPDTPTYVAAADRLASGVPDMVRTPSYPLIILVARSIFGPSAWPLALVIIQYLALVASSLVFVRIGQRLGIRERIMFWLTLVYMVASANLAFTTFVLTETAATIGVVMYIWCMLRRFPAAPRCADMAWASALLIFLMFLRPIFIYLLLVQLAYCALILAKYRRTGVRAALAALAGFVVATSLLLAYKHEIGRRYHLTSVCSISTVNNYYLVRYAEISDPDLTDDPKLKEFVRSTIPNNKDGFVYSLVDEEYDTLFSSDVEMPVIEAYVNAAIREYPFEIAKASVMRLIRDIFGGSLVDSKIPRMVHIERSYFPSFGNCFLALVILWIMAFVQWIRHNDMPLAALLLLLISSGIYFATVVGAMSDWSRLLVPGIPPLLLLLGMFVNRYRRNSYNLR